MTLKTRIRSRLFARVAMPILVASGLAACSDIPDWVDPTTWIGGDSQTASDQDQAANAGTDSAQTPDIASIPAKPAPPSTSDEQKQVAESLEADRTKAHYSADALRGGTEAAAPPPPAEPAPAPAPADHGASSAPTKPSTDSGPAADAGAPAASETEAPDQSAAASPPPAPAPEPAAAPPPSASANQMASADAASASEPVAAPMPAATAAGNMQASFAPSSAPPLDPSVAKFVPRPILSRYQQTAAAASAPGVADEPSTVKAAHRHRKKAKPAAAAQP